MICIKCGEHFTATQKAVVCSDCREEHRAALGILDGSSNITLQDAERLREKMSRELEAVNMLIAGRGIAEIAEFMDMPRRRVSLFFSQKVRWALAEKDESGKIRKPADKKLVYKPLWPENLYCAVFGVYEYRELPADVEATIEYLLGTLTERESRIVLDRFKDGATLEDAAALHKVTSERVRQVESKAMRRIRRKSMTNNTELQAQATVAAKKVCVNDCPAAYPTCMKCKKVIPLVGKENICPLAKYNVPQERNPKPWHEIGAAEVMSYGDSFALCACCEYGKLSKDETEVTRMGFCEVCIDCPVNMCEDNLEEAEAEARMS